MRRKYLGLGCVSNVYKIQHGGNTRVDTGRTKRTLRMSETSALSTIVRKPDVIEYATMVYDVSDNQRM